MKTWWLQLSLREKQTIGMGAIVIGLFLVYALIFAPLSNAVQSLRVQVKRNQELLAWMKKSDEKIQILEKMNHPLTGNKSSAALLGLVQNDINKNSIAKQVSQLQQADNDSIQLKLQQANFDDSMTWLINLCQHQQLAITQATIKPNTAPGMVDAELRLQVG